MTAAGATTVDELCAASAAGAGESAAAAAVKSRLWLVWRDGARGVGGLRMGMRRGLGLSVGAPREARARAETGCVRAQRAAKKMYAEASGQILPLIY